MFSLDSKICPSVEVAKKGGVGVGKGPFHNADSSDCRFTQITEGNRNASTSPKYPDFLSMSREYQATSEF
jgi:hypothetical protein